MRRIQESEVREALKRLKGGKAMGPDGIPIKVWRCPRDSYSMVNQDVQQYLSIEQDAWDVEKKHIGTNLQEQGRYPKLY